MKGSLEYIAQMSESDKRRFRNLIENLLSHHLKISYVGGRDVNHWQREIREWEDSLFKLVVDTAPGLKSEQIDLHRIYRKLTRRGPFPGDLARNYPTSNFPDVCPFALKDIIGERAWNELKRA